MKGISPCLTRSRAGSGGFWLSWQNRFMTTNEIIKLMGVWPDDVPENVVSDRTLRLIAGNAIVVPVLARLLQALLQATGM